MDFNKWKQQINEILENNTGLGCDCLIDIPYWDYWSSGYSSIDAAKEVVIAEWGSAGLSLIKDMIDGY